MWKWLAKLVLKDGTELEVPSTGEYKTKEQALEGFSRFMRGTNSNPKKAGMPDGCKVTGGDLLYKQE